MQFLSIITLLLVLVSLAADRGKTWLGLKKGFWMFVKILPAILSVLILVSIVLYFLPDELIVSLLGKEAGVSGYFLLNSV